MKFLLTSYFFTCVLAISFSQNYTHLREFNNGLAKDFLVNQGLKESYFYAPYSQTRLLGTLLEATSGETQTQLKKYICPSDSVSKFRTTLLATHKEYIWKKYDKANYFRFYNTIVVNKNTRIDTAYKATLKKHYGSTFKKMDFKAITPGVKSLNEWIYRKSRGQLSDVFEKEQFTVNTQLLAIDLAVFKASWEYKFNQNYTKLESFYCYDKIVQVKMMKSEEVKLLSSNQKGVQYVLLPYKGNGKSMVIAMPLSTKVPLSNIKTDFNFLFNKQTTETIIKMPKFEIYSQLLFTDFYKAKGLKNLFVFTNDYQNVFPNHKRPLKTKGFSTLGVIKVDEKGSKGAVVSYYEMDGWGDEEESKPLEITIDQPFAYFIIDNKTKIILFAGAYSGQE